MQYKKCLLSQPEKLLLFEASTESRCKHTQFSVIFIVSGAGGMQLKRQQSTNIGLKYSNAFLKQDITTCYIAIAQILSYKVFMTFTACKR